MDNLYYLIAFTLINWVGLYFISYLRKKGENTATKEDVKEITRIIESVKNEISNQKETKLIYIEFRESLIKIRLNLTAQLMFASLYKSGQIDKSNVLQKIINNGDTEYNMATSFVEKNIVYMPEDIRELVHSLYEKISKHGITVLTKTLKKEEIVQLISDLTIQINYIIHKIEELIYST